MIRLEKVHKEYHNHKILKNINLNFRKNELVCILGPSGSGKSTLLNIIAKLDTPTKGEIFLGNKPVNKINDDYYHNSVISIIFQDYNLINTLNAKDNITLPLRLTGKNIDKAKLNIIAKDLDIKDLLNKPLNKLSGGEKQRMAITRGLLANSKILLADEPTGALDSENSLKVMKILKNISKVKLVIMVTHNKELASKFADRVIELKDGRIINDNKPYKENICFEYKPKKTKLKIKDKYKIAFNNLKNKKLRNILTILAFSIGLFSLSLILSISNGFTKELTKLEKESFYSYPLIISKESISLTTSFNDNTNYEKNKININNNNKLITNNIDNKLLSKLNILNNKWVEEIVYYRDIDYKFKNISHINPTNNYFKLLSGSFPTTKDEVLLLLDYNYSIDEKVKKYLDLNELTYKEALNKTIKLDNKSLKITGIVTSKNDYYSSLNGILYSNELFNEEITDIYIFPKDYKSKNYILKELNDYSVIDNAKEVINLTKSLIDGITLVLIIFSLVSLLVSIIMISVMTYISVIERQKEIGLMRSIGTSKKDIKKLFLTENKIIALISASLALTSTKLISLIFNDIIKNSIGINNIIKLNYKIILIILILSILLSLLAGIFPSKFANKKEIIDNLKV